MNWLWADLPDECPHCGGPFMAVQGQTVISTITMTLLPDGGVEVDPTTTANWCGKCVADWNARMGFEPNGTQS